MKNIIFVFMSLCLFFLNEGAVEAKKGANKFSLIVMTRYLKVVHDKIQKNWDFRKIPLMELHRRSATFTLWFSPKGRLLKVKLFEKSGYPLFDRTLLKSIYKSSPYPPPPLNIRRYVARVGLQITFRKRVFKKKLLPLKRRYIGNARIPNWRPAPIKPRKK